MVVHDWFKFYTKMHSVYCAKTEVETNSYIKQDKLSSAII